MEITCWNGRHAGWLIRDWLAWAAYRMASFRTTGKSSHYRTYDFGEAREWKIVYEEEAIAYNSRTIHSHARSHMYFLVPAVAGSEPGLGLNHESGRISIQHMLNLWSTN